MALHKFQITPDCPLNVTSLFIQIRQLSEEEQQQLDTDELLKHVHETCYPTENPYYDFLNNIHEEYPEYMVPNEWLSLYVPPVLLSLGTFGNLFSFIILAKSIFKVSTYSYLAVLAIMDMLVLYIGLLRMWVGNFAVDIQHSSNCMCKLVNFLGYVCSDTSVWLIIAVTIERFIAVNFPLRAPRMCNVHRARFVIIGIVCIICAINSHIIWTVELKYLPHNGSYVSRCDASEDHKTLVKEAWPWVDAAIYSFVPFFIITILNVLIIRQVLKARERRTHLQHLEVTSKVNGIIYKTQTKRSNESNKKLTCMLLAVSFTFLLTTLPMNLLQIVTAFSGPKTEDIGSKEYHRKYAQFTLARTVVELLMYVNHSINFFLYCATGRKFRLQFRLMVCLCCQGKIKDFFKLGKKRSMTTSTNSYRLTRLNSHSSPRSLVIECDKRFAVGQYK